jgi:hypothetical protein
VSNSDIAELRSRWLQTKESAELPRLAADLSAVVGRIHSYGLEAPVGMPVLLLMHADVLHRLGMEHGRCAAGSTTLGQLMVIASVEFRQAQKVFIDAMLTDFKNCPDAGAGLKTGLAQGRQYLSDFPTVAAAPAQQKFNPNEPYMVQVDSIGRAQVTQLTPGTQAAPRALETVLHAIEASLTRFVCQDLLGKDMTSTLEELPLLNPDGSEFRRILWWCALAAALVGLRVLVTVPRIVVVGLIKLVKLFAQPSTSRRTVRWEASASRSRVDASDTATSTKPRRVRNIASVKRW